MLVLLGAGIAYELWTNGGRWRGRASSFSLGPLAIVVLALGTITVSLTAEIFWEGLKAGLLTFGGAFTVIPFLQESAVDGQGWLTDSQFVDGLAISGILPAPLIIFSTFVGYLAGGTVGALAMTLGIFLPAFVFPIFFHRGLVAVAENPRIRPFLLGVAAGGDRPDRRRHGDDPRNERGRRADRDPRRWRLPRPQPLARQADCALRGARLRRDRRGPAAHGPVARDTVVALTPTQFRLAPRSGSVPRDRTLRRHRA